MRRGKHLRIKSPARFIISISLMLLIVCSAFGVCMGLNTAKGSVEQKYISIEVLSGETLWDIAEQHMDSDMDTREAVYQIKKANDLDDSELHPGQIIKVPVS